MKPLRAKSLKISPEQQAECIGQAEGLLNIHASGQNFETGAEWIAWLRGWRSGQTEFMRRTTAIDPRRTHFKRLLGLPKRKPGRPCITYPSAEELSHQIIEQAKRSIGAKGQNGHRANL